jgi:hypothetical protein
MGQGVWGTNLKKPHWGYSCEQSQEKIHDSQHDFILRWETNRIKERLDRLRILYGLLSAIVTSSLLTTQ